MCEIIFTIVVRICQMIVAHFGRCSRVDAHGIRHFVHPLEYSVRPSHVADSCHQRIPEMLIESSPTQVVLEVPAHFISKMYFTHWEPPGVSERRRSVNLEASISGEHQTLGGYSGRQSE
jgi:hypothetical protein